MHPAIVDASWGETEAAGDEIITATEGQSPARCLFDLSEMTYLSSAQVALIVRVWKAVRAREGQLAIACPNDVVCDVLSLAGLDKLIEVAPTREAARQALDWERAGWVGRWSAVLTGLAILGTVTALAGLVMHLSGSWGVGDVQVIEFTGSVIAFISGVALVTTSRDWRWWLGLGAMVVTFVAALSSLWISRSQRATSQVEGRTLNAEDDERGEPVSFGTQTGSEITADAGRQAPLSKCSHALNRELTAPDCDPSPRGLSSVQHATLQPGVLRRRT